MVMAVNNDEDHGNIIFLYVLIGRPVEVKYTADLFLLSSQEGTSCTLANLWFLTRFQHPASEILISFSTVGARRLLALSDPGDVNLLSGPRTTIEQKKQFIAHIHRLCLPFLSSLRQQVGRLASTFFSVLQTSSLVRPGAEAVSKIWSHGRAAASLISLMNLKSLIVDGAPITAHLLLGFNVRS